MNQAPSIERIAQESKRGFPFERVVLVLQGGGALGAAFDQDNTPASHRLLENPLTGT